jgi:N-acetylglucosamine-6-phosphate deacetylase
LNGAFGHDFTADPTTIWRVAAELPRTGVTSFLPTIITSPPETVALAQAVLANGRGDEKVGARPLGLHVEGPFFNPAKKGAHNPALLRLPSPAGGIELMGKAALQEDPLLAMIASYRRKLSMALN